MKLLFRILFLAGLGCAFPVAGAEILIATNAVWKYLDDGSNQNTAWRGTGFVDTAWSSGPAELGYGDDVEGRPEATVINGGPATNRIVTTYFRRTFVIASPADWAFLQIRLMRDDGAVVYLNGTEMFRSNMPEGTIAFNTFAALATGGAEEFTFFNSTNVSPTLLLSGNNVLAVEVHQQSPTSSDVSFALELNGTRVGGNSPPTVSLDNPLEGQVFTAPASILLQAAASDAEGPVNRVEFFEGNTKLGESSVSPYQYSWTSVPTGAYALSAVAWDGGGLKATSAVVHIVVSDTGPVSLVTTGSVWKYLDDGSDQGTGWIDPGFIDDTWNSGPGELGYGDLDEATVVGFGGNPGAKFVTTYFRRRFTATNPAQFQSMKVRVLRDDGVIVYLNGTEIFRDNLPTGTVLFNTYAPIALEDNDTFLETSADPGLLVDGDNVLAVEIHQATPNSSDISFELELIASPEAVINNPPSVVLTSPLQGSVYTAPANVTLTAVASDSDGSISLVEFFQNGVQFAQDTSSPYNAQATSLGIGSYSFHAVATDNLGKQATSSVSTVSVVVSTPPTVVGTVPAPGPITNLSQITVRFSEPVSGVDAGDLMINGIPAQSVSGEGTNYTFVCAPPGEGTVYCAWVGDPGIRDFESPPKALDPYGPGTSWQYTLTDTVRPAAILVDPTPGSTVPRLNRIRVTFSEPVQGIQTNDLTINGQPALAVEGHGDGPYDFEVRPLTNGTAAVTWAGAHGITDLATVPNTFPGGSWNYQVQSNLVVEGQVVLNEIMYHPVSQRLDEEYLELCNRGVTAVNVTGWRLTRGVDFLFPAASIPSGGYLVVAANVARFTAKYPGVANVIGGWTGRLSNSGEEIELEDALGDRVDLVAYADEGDWSIRRPWPLDPQGLEWYSPADGFGPSLELRNAALPNESGQNWASSLVNEGTPGAVNTVASDDIAPLILAAQQIPVLPRSTNAITITAVFADELALYDSVQVYYRDASTLTPGPFTAVNLVDDGNHNDGIQGDGIFGVILPAQSAGTVLEYYVQVVDILSQVRTWPGPVEGQGQTANAHILVSDEVYSGSQPVYHLIMTAADQNRFDSLNRFSNAQFNNTLLTIERDEIEVRHNCGIRYRGASSRSRNPPTWKFEIPTDRKWNGKSSMNLNSQYTQSQVLGSAVARAAGMPAGEARAIQLRRNGTNPAGSGSPQFGSYAHLEVLDDEWAQDHFPEDGDGNVYSKRRPESDLNYLGTNPQSYINVAYDKESNASENDWTDLMELTRALDPAATPDSDYIRALLKNVNVTLWLRYLAVHSLMEYSETALGSGVGDDYGLYRGIENPRFMALAHDLDTVFGQGDCGGCFDTNTTIFVATALPTMNRLLHHPEIEPLFYAEFRHQLNNAFHTNRIFPMVDQFLGGWVPADVHTTIKNFIANRNDRVLAQLPPAPAVLQATVSGEPDSPNYASTATLSVGGTGITHYRYRLNNGAYSAERLVSQPINLTGLADGTYTVFVVGRDASFNWQSEATPTVSRTWTVLSRLRRVVFSEVLARNDSAVNHENTFPDLVELYNAGSGLAVLSGMRLTTDLDQPNQFVFPQNTSLISGTYLVLYANDPDGTTGLHLGFNLNQNGETLYLLEPASAGNRVVDQIRFGLQLPNLSIGRQPTGAWGLCTPTFGSANVVAVTGNPVTLRINEWLANPQSPFVEDFLELYNPDPLPVALGGLLLTDKPLGLPGRSPIVPLSFIGGLGYRAFIADGNLSAGADHVDFQLQQEGGQIALLTGAGEVIDSIVYGLQAPGISQGRSPNGSATILPLSQPSPGVGNPVPPGPTQPLVVNLIPIDGVFQWRYNDSGTNLGTAWRDYSYPDSAWPQGPALLGLETDPIPEPIRTILNVQSPKVTYYFRAHFNLPANLSLSDLEWQHVIDDGAVVYLNGQEAARYNLPSGVVTNGTLATTVPNATYQGPFSLPITNLQSGDNVIAVEVHQNNPTSPDLVFGLRLNAILYTNNPAQAGLVINEVLANDVSLITTNVAGNVTNIVSSTADLVELYNPSGDGVDVSGMSLTDDLDNIRRWVIPAGISIESKGYLVIRFDAGTPPTTNIGATVLNTGFGLDANGDELYLYNRPNAGGEWLDGITFGLQAANFSLGRSTDGGSNWVLTLPTLGSGNLPAAMGPATQLKVNEWLASNPDGNDWFEIYNPNPQPVELSGLHLTDSLTNRLQHSIAPRSFIGTEFFAYQVFVADNDLRPGAHHVNFRLSAGGESIGLSDAAGNLIDSVNFGPQALNVSQGRVPDGGSTVSSFPQSPTPSESNYLPIPNVQINEVLSHTDLPFEDAIELRNTSPSPVSIGGWFLSDQRRFLNKFRIPNNTSIPGNGFKVFYEDQFNPRPGDPDSFALNSAHGNSLYLSASTAGGQLNGYRTAVSFGAAQNGTSFGRYVTSALNSNKVEFVSMTSRSFGKDNPESVQEFRTGAGLTNTAPKVGPIVINEIMYHPPDIGGTNDNVRDEFIELYNPSQAPVALYDVSYPSNRWRLTEAVDFHFPPNTSIAAGGYLVVVSFDPMTNQTALAAFRNAYGISNNVNLVGPYQGKLDNSNERIELKRPDTPQLNPGPDYGFVPYILMEEVEYFDTAPWPTTPDTSGLSLQRVNATTFGNDVINWTAGTPKPGPQSGGSLDNDSDGMPNDWEILYQFQVNNSIDAGQDADNDGVTNLDEYLAGTNPRNPMSLLRLRIITSAPVTLQFTAGSNRTYTVEYQGDLDPLGAWQVLWTEPAAGVERTITLSDQTAPAKRFYRLRVP